MSDRNKKNDGRMPSGSIYVIAALAVCVVTVVTIVVIGASMGSIDISVPDTSFGTVSRAPAEDSSNTGGDESDDRQTGNDVSGVPADVTQSKYVKPVDGELLKAFSIDALVFSQSMRDWRTHNGIDIAGDVGSSVYCFADGVVSAVYQDALYGTTVVITHSGGLVSTYMNLDPALEPKIVVDSAVRAGAKIGVIGNTASAEAADNPHLHLEMTLDGELIDPLTELQKADELPVSQTK